MSRLSFAVLFLVGCAGGNNTCPAPAAPSATAPAPMVLVQPQAPTDPPLPSYPEGGLSTQIQLVRDALVADQAGDHARCIQLDRAALAISENSRTRLHLASCEGRSGHLVAAQADAASSLSQAEQAKDQTVTKVARARVNELDNRIPTVHAAFTSGTTVSLDQQVLSPNAKTVVDPGLHIVTVTFAGAAPIQRQFALAEHEDLAVEVDAAKKTFDGRTSVRAAQPVSSTRAATPLGL